MADFCKQEIDDELSAAYDRTKKFYATSEGIGEELPPLLLLANEKREMLETIQAAHRVVGHEYGVGPCICEYCKPEDAPLQVLPCRACGGAGSTCIVSCAAGMFGVLGQTSGVNVLCLICSATGPCVETRAEAIALWNAQSKEKTDGNEV